MKKSLFCALVILSFAGSAFAVSSELTTHTPTAAAGVAIRGGSTAALAEAAPTPLIKFSTGVYGKVNYEDSGNPVGSSTGYTIATRHLTGSKYFATTNSKTNIYWKQASKVDTTNKVDDLFKSEVAAQIDTLFSFGGGGWTSY